MAVSRTKKRDQQTTRAKLLKAALDVFSKNGYDAATTRNIAKKANVNEALIHRYFGSKHGLFLALNHQLREKLVTQFLEYEKSETLQDELVNFLLFRTEFTSKSKKFFRIYISRAILDPKLRDDVRNYAEFKPKALLERFEIFRRKGQIRDDVDLEQFIAILRSFAFSLSILMDAIGCLRVQDAEKMIRTAAKYLADGVGS